MDNSDQVETKVEVVLNIKQLLKLGEQIKTYIDEHKIESVSGIGIGRKFTICMKEEENKVNEEKAGLEKYLKEQNPGQDISNMVNFKIKKDLPDGIVEKYQTTYALKNQ